MKKLTMWLGCALTAFAIGCGDENTKSSPSAMPDPKTMMPDPAKMKDMMGKNAPKDAGASDTSTEKPADAEKKDGDTEKPADAEKKDGDAVK